MAQSQGAQFATLIVGFVDRTEAVSTNYGSMSNDSMTMSAPWTRVNLVVPKPTKRLSRKYSHRLCSRCEGDLVAEPLQPTDKRVGETRCTKLLVVVGSEFTKRAIVLEQVVG